MAEAAVAEAVVSAAAGSAVFCRQAKRVRVYQSEDRRQGGPTALAWERLGLKQLTPSLKK